jgi:hypothetical protein
MKALNKITFVFGARPEAQFSDGARRLDPDQLQDLRARGCLQRPRIVRMQHARRD